MKGGSSELQDIVFARPNKRHGEVAYPPGTVLGFAGGASPRPRRGLVGAQEGASQKA